VSWRLKIYSKSGIKTMNLAELYLSLPARFPELRGQVALVTGSSQGIGLGIAARLAREGMRVVITGLEGEQVESVTNELKGAGADVLGVPANLSSSTEIESLFQTMLGAFGTIDVLVNNAADLRRMAFSEVSENLIDYQLAVNIKAPLVCSQRAGAIMCAAKKGRIISITSPGAERAHLPGLPYDATKGAINSMTRALAVEYAQYNVLVNAVAPGWANTWHAGEITGEAQEVAARIPLGRPLKFGEIGGVVAFLASPDADYVTGQIYYMDGGVTAQMSPPGQPI
jgi:3-oxoacyl-[acyl-carrier protein] reductase